MIKIVKENGETYETPIENLENVRRLIKIRDIIYPDAEMEEEVIEEYKEKEEEVTPKPAKGKPTKKPIKS
jgi:hypothetical protein